MDYWKDDADPGFGCERGCKLVMHIRTGHMAVHTNQWPCRCSSGCPTSRSWTARRSRWRSTRPRSPRAHLTLVLIEEHCGLDACSEHFYDLSIMRLAAPSQHCRLGSSHMRHGGVTPLCKLAKMPFGGAVPHTGIDCMPIKTDWTMTRSRALRAGCGASWNVWFIWKAWWLLQPHSSGKCVPWEGH